MKKLTEEQIKLNDSIPTSEILQDIEDTQNEINDFQAEKDILMKRPTENKVRIYLLEGNILKRQDFIGELNQIIDYRKLQTILEEK